MTFNALLAALGLLPPHSLDLPGAATPQAPPPLAYAFPAAAPSPLGFGAGFSWGFGASPPGFDLRVGLTVKAP
ncbi:hypothetical protein [Rhodoblastus sp.]|uniref:hypothetical protein n=1 Tax=Rhodoblastus sp. TaxID=1962975 RepID=UPI003F9E3340